LNKAKIIAANINSKTVTAKILEDKEILISFATHPSFHTYKAENIVPTLSALEMPVSYLNLEHRPQEAGAVYFLGNDINNISDFISKSIPDSLFLYSSQNRESEMYLEETMHDPEILSDFRNISSYFIDSIGLYSYQYKVQTKVLLFVVFQKMKNFYQNSTMTLNSKILESCTKYKKNKHLNFRYRTHDIDDTF
jgi:hypothetical protein